jgi:hypothetical protein
MLTDTPDAGKFFEFLITAKYIHTFFTYCSSRTRRNTLVACTAISLNLSVGRKFKVGQYRAIARLRSMFRMNEQSMPAYVTKPGFPGQMPVRHMALMMFPVDQLRSWYCDRPLSLLLNESDQMTRRLIQKPVHGFVMMFVYQRRAVLYCL